MISLLDTNFSSLNHFLTNRRFSKIFILTDENTHEYCLPLLLGNLETEAPIEILEIEPGEEMKNISTAVQLWEILAEFGADRKALLINLGGGVITDLGGFVASTYKRGISFVHLPTTLLGMCDASIGGKTGIDHHFLKNIIGTFAPPEAIFVYADFLKTLPEKELRSGFAEMLKHGLIADRVHWKDLSLLNEVSADSVAPYIYKSMNIKEEVVIKDFREENIRKTLNFGHTVGHALESLFLKNGNAVTHGEAVAAGMICELKIAELEGLLSSQETEEITQVLHRFYNWLDLTAFTDEEILQLMMNDKKTQCGEIRFALITGAGHCIFDYKPSHKSIIHSLNYYRIPTF